MHRSAGSFSCPPVAVPFTQTGPWLVGRSLVQIKLSCAQSGGMLECCAPSPFVTIGPCRLICVVFVCRFFQLCVCQKDSSPWTVAFSCTGWSLRCLNFGAKETQAWHPPLRETDTVSTRFLFQAALLPSPPFPYHSDDNFKLLGATLGFPVL